MVLSAVVGNCNRIPKSPIKSKKPFRTES